MFWKNLGKISKSFFILIPTTSLIVSVPVGVILTVNKSNILNESKMMKWNFDNSIINKYNLEYYTNDLSLEYNKNNLLDLKADLNVKTNLDSYTRQYSQFTNSPTATATVKYEKSRYVKKWKFNLDWLKTKNAFITQLNDNWFNEYKINMSPWSAYSSQRYVGNIIWVPMYSNGVKIQQNAITFDKIDLTFRNIAVDIINKTINLINFEDNKLAKWLLDSLISAIDNNRNATLRPKLVSLNNDTNTFETKYSDFGNFQTRYIESNNYNLAIKSNNSIPFTTNVLKPLAKEVYAHTI